MAPSRIVDKELILNLFTLIDKTGNYRIEYEYGAMGNKYRQTVIHGGKVAKVIDLVGNFVYERNHLAWQSFDEGRVVYKNDSEHPVVLNKNQSKIRGYIEKISNNKAVFYYKFKKHNYERWQLLRENHTLKQGHSIDIIVITPNPKIGVLDY